MSRPVQALARLIRNTQDLPANQDHDHKDRTGLSSRILAIGLLTAGFIGHASALTEVDEAPFRIQQGGTPIACNGTPFGRRIPIGIDQEVLLTVKSSETGVGQNFQFSGDLQLERSADPLDGVLTNAPLTTAPVDLNGDGLDELVVVSETSADSIGVRVLRRDPQNPNGNAQIGGYEWTLNSPISFEILDVAVTAADLDGSTDGKEEVAIGILYRTAGETARIQVIALSGDANGNIQQASETALATFTQPYDNGGEVSEASLQIAAGDVLLEGRDQIVMYYDGGLTVLRGEGSAVGSGPSMTFNDRQFLDSDVPNGECQSTPELVVGNFGGSAASEVVIYKAASQGDCGTSSIRADLFYFPTTRDEDNEIVDFTINSAGTQSSPSSSNVGIFAAAAGEMDRRPGEEIVLAWQDSLDANTFRVEMFRVRFNTSGQPIGIGPSDPPAFATVTDNDLQLASGIDIALGDAEGDAIGDVYVATRIARSGPRVPALFKLSMTRPTNPNEFPDVTTFGLVDSITLPSLFSVDPAFLNEIHVADWDNDSVLGDLGTTCVRVREPLVRSVVKLPPYWERLQSAAPEDSVFEASIGESGSLGQEVVTEYGSFNSSDFSGFVGVTASAGLFGIGIETTVKATAGRNEQASRGEIFSDTITTEASEKRAQQSGEGLVVVENNNYDCYTYDVLQNGAPAEESSLRVCEWVSGSRGTIASDLDTWDRQTAQGVGGQPPSQWAPLNPDWASIALFRPTSTNQVPMRGTSADQIVDGRFNTALEADESTQPYVDIDLGEPRDIANIRVWPQAGQAATLVGFNLYASTTPFPGSGLPSGADVRIFQPDPVAGNGVDRWNIHTRAAGNGFEPLRARYIRLQHPDVASLRVAEIQVFGDQYLEPPAYPLSVCDPFANDGLFLARIADTVAPTTVYRNVQVRGDLSWTGAATDPDCGPNHADLPDGQGDGFGRIWGGLEVGEGGTGTNSWELAQATASAYGEFQSISHSNRAGAEIEVQVGSAVAGAAYSFESGTSRENSTTMFWEESLQYSGTVGGFRKGEGAGCGYRPQPYSYVTNEKSNLGYSHQYTVVSYVVEGIAWNRLGPNFPPSSCFTPPDSLFNDRFEPAVR